MSITKADLGPGNPQRTDRTIAAVVGGLFIIGTVSGVLAAGLVKPILDAPDYLARIAASESRFIIAGLLQLIMGLACAGVGLALYPLLRKYSAGLAIGSAGMRVMEGVLNIIAALGLVILLALSQESVKGGAPDAGYFQTTSVLINAASDWLNNVAVLLTWCIGALMYYALFYRYQLVPRWLAAWGLVGISMTITGSLLVLSHLIPPFGTIQVILNLPILPQEMVFAVWLIVKGVKPSPTEALLAKTMPNELLNAAL